MNTPVPGTGYSPNDNPIGIIILAAGVSARLGRAKQLLTHRNGQTLIARTCQLALNSGLQPIVLVLGARKDLILDEVKGLDVPVAFNELWTEGIAGSIKRGLTQLLEKAPALAAVVILVCDQPFLTSEIIKNLVSIYSDTGKPIIASSYHGALGTPVLFDRSFFASILQLEGDKGAAKIIHQNPDQVAIVSFDEGALDIDTEEDYDLYIK